MYFRVNEFEVGVNDGIFSGNEQRKVYYTFPNEAELKNAIESTQQ